MLSIVLSPTPTFTEYGVLDNSFRPKKKVEKVRIWKRINKKKKAFQAKNKKVKEVGTKFILA